MLSFLGMALIVFGVKEMISCPYGDVKRFLPGLMMIAFGVACLSAAGI